MARLLGLTLAHLRVIRAFFLPGLRCIFHKSSIHYSIGKMLVNRYLSKELITGGVLQAFLFARAQCGPSYNEVQSSKPEKRSIFKNMFCHVSDPSFLLGTCSFLGKAARREMSACSLLLFLSIRFSFALHDSLRSTGPGITSAGSVRAELIILLIILRSLFQ